MYTHYACVCLWGGGGGGESRYMIPPNLIVLTDFGSVSLL